MFLLLFRLDGYHNKFGLVLRGAAQSVGYFYSRISNAKAFDWSLKTDGNVDAEQPQYCFGCGLSASKPGR